MRAVIQKVLGASVTVDGVLRGEIKGGLLVFLGIEANDGKEDIDWLSRKIPQIRVFHDAEGLMNISLKDSEGGILLISQFTLYGNLRKGTRPSFNRAAPPDIAVPLYNEFHRALEAQLGKPVPAGEFGGDMKINALNDGPVTLIIDSKDKRF